MSEKSLRVSYFAVENQELWVEHIDMGKHNRFDIKYGWAVRRYDSAVFEKNTIEWKNFKRI